MWHIRFFRFSLSLFFSLYAFFSLCSVVCFGDTIPTVQAIESTDVGKLNLIVKSDFELTEDIKINIQDKKFETEIYSLVSKSKNNWVIDDKIPAGKYLVNFITIGDGKNKYALHYSDTITFKAGKKTDFEIVITDSSKLGSAGRRSLGELIKDNTINLILILTGLILLLILKRRRDKTYE